MSITSVLLLWTSCSSESYIHRLETQQQFEEFAGPPLTDKYHEISAVKVVYHLSTQKIYYLNHQNYKLHFDFCNRLKGDLLDAYTFNQHNYTDNPYREFLLGNINYNKTSNTYFLELSPTDKMPTEQIVLLYKRVVESSFIRKDLKFFLNNTSHLENKELQKRIPTIHPKEIYGNLTYQPIKEGTVIGRIKFAKTSDLKNAQLEPTDIIILDRTPQYVPQVAAIVVSELQTPLSHLTILGQNRGIPICASLNAFRDTVFRMFENMKVEFTVSSNKWTAISTEKDFSQIRSLPNIKLRYDTIQQGLISLSNVDKQTRKAIGNKAANLAMLQKLAAKRSFKTPEGAFAIPFYYYQQHITNSPASTLLDSLWDYQWTPSDRRILLKKIRKEIKNHPIDTHLLLLVMDRMQSDSLFHRLRFRSSTNAEDENGFSGAGLYDSKTGILHHDKKTVERAIKNVWASLWNEQAYVEREIFGIDQQSVFMGILAHRSFPSEEVNGVAITKNLYRPDNEGYVVNVQKGEKSVVKPDSGEVTDQFICFPKQLGYLGLYENDVVDIITTSSYGDGQLLMTDEEIGNLANELYAIKRYFSTRMLLSYSQNAFDVEFKLYGPTREFYIKQVRVYNQ